MQFFKKILLILIVFFSLENTLLTDVPYFINFKYILNESKAGKEAQEFLKKKLANGIKKLQDQEKAIQDSEKKIIQQKKVTDPEEYKKKVKELRNRVALLQKERDSLLDGVAKQRAKARNELLKNLNPIMKEYMKEKKIRMVINKSSILLADENLDITKDIISILNKKLKSIKLN